MSSTPLFRLLPVLVAASLLLPGAARAADGTSWNDVPPAPAPAPALPSPASTPAPLVEVLFPNADPPPAAAPPKDAPSSLPVPPLKKERMPLRLAVGAGVLGSGLGTTPTGLLLLDIPTSNARLAARLWADVPLASGDVVSDGGVSAYSVWTAGGGIVGALTDPTKPLVLRVHGGWGGTIVHVAGVSAEPASGLRLGRRPADLFTLLGQTGFELSYRVHPMFAVVGSARAGLTLSRLVVDHEGPSGQSAGAWGVPFGGVDLRLEVHL